MKPADPEREAGTRDPTGNGAILARFHVAVLAFQRVRQLRDGARPRLEAGEHTLARVAILEAIADLITWNVEA
jgi:DNA-directed RNA polymerase subunit K/omega